MRHRQRSIVKTGLATVIALTFVTAVRADLIVFSAGMTLPQTISEAPTDFGTAGGNYFIPDSVAATIWEVPHAGGAPTAFVTDPALRTAGGLFLPAGWGANSGKFLLIGTTFQNPTGFARVYDSAGGVSQLATGGPTQTQTPAIAPAGFGSHGGNVFITSQTGTVVELKPDGSLTTFATTSTDFSFRNFGIAFAPQDWGKFGGDMLVSNGVDNRIDAIDADGNVTEFTAIQDSYPGFGLRQMAFAPAGFLPGIDKPLLFVSESGSGGGGGTLGDIVALDSSGTVVASLRTSRGLTKFDPRGLLFLADGSFLVSDASDPILLGHADDFVVAETPEPGSSAMLAGCLATLFLMRRRAAKSQ